MLYSNTIKNKFSVFAKAASDFNFIALDKNNNQMDATNSGFGQSNFGMLDNNDDNKSQSDNQMQLNNSMPRK